MKRVAVNGLLQMIGFRFYKEQMGFLMMIFGILFIHIFWIQPLGGHLTHEQSVSMHLILLQYFASEPIMLILFLVVWSGYGIRVYGFIKKKLQLETNQFLFYSFNALNFKDQFPYWLILMGWLFLPAIFLIMGIFYVGIKYDLYSFLTIYPAFIITLIILFSFLSFRQVNKVFSKVPQLNLGLLINLIRKPLWVIPLLHFLLDHSLILLVFKVITLLIGLGGVYLFEDLGIDVRVFQLITLTLAVSNSYLIYTFKKFEDRYLTFIRNFSESKIKAFSRIVFAFGILMIPEISLIIINFQLIYFIPLSVLLMGTILCFYIILQRFRSIQSYYLYIFTGYIGLVLLILSGVGWSIILTVPFSIIYFYYNYYRNIIVE